ncbi:hypothetical protein AcV5_004980 [Taiwanofungus camphoratus]|nr:hypothetical protein AcW2_000425 [Antrodia cinnamomea]KAI0936968.1 hypothetical protein AcV5_004980 [Antrodia cinnamomea]
MPRSDSRSPSRTGSRKKMRLSSPTYEEQCCFNQEEIRAFDAFETQMSQSQHSSSPRPSQALSQADRKKRSQAIAFALQELKDGNSGNTDDNCSSLEGFPSSPLGDPTRLNNKPQSIKTVINRANSTTAGSEFVSANYLNETNVQYASTPSVHGRPTGFTSAALLIQSVESGQSLTDNQTHTSSTDVNGMKTPAKLSGFGFASALDLVTNAPSGAPDCPPSSSPDGQPEQDDSSWFSLASIPSGAVVGFQSAKTLKDSADPAGVSITALPGFMSGRSLLNKSQTSEGAQGPSGSMSSESAMIGFTSGLTMMRAAQSTESGRAKANNWTNPSAEALARAEQRMKQWEQEMDADFIDLSRLESESDLESSRKANTSTIQTPARPALRSVENSFSTAQLPASPSPTGMGFSRPGTTGESPGIMGKSKAFKPPLLTRPPLKPTGMSPYIGSPLNPNQSSNTGSGSKLPVSFTTALGATTSNATGFISPIKALGLNPRRVGVTTAVGKPKFVTPFKLGMKPGEPGGTQLEQTQARSQEEVNVIAVDMSAKASNRGTMETSSHTKGKGRATFFDLTKPADRQTLASCGLVPQSYNLYQLNYMGIDVDELSRITPNLALYYSFHCPSSSNSEDSTSSSLTFLGPDAALNRLKEIGCSLVTKSWVDNHWGLILWKLAGMVCFQPEHESNPDMRRWCWREVMKQLIYRYERELNGASRPALRLITTHDAPASCPMVLCISDVIWHEGGMTQDGTQCEPYPELEVTDGWYRLRASVDGPLQRATQRGVIRVGRKIAVAGARLVSERKEPAEILEVYDSTRLQFFGNSSHLAPWHAKLGFVKIPYVATFDSLTCDGGLVTLMDVTVTKAYPIAFIEFSEQNNRKIHDGPYNERDEAMRDDKWMKRRCVEEEKLRHVYEKRFERLEDFASRYEDRAGPKWRPTGDECPMRDTDRLYEELEEPGKGDENLFRLTPDACGWLARHIRIQVQLEREQMYEEVQRELTTTCPPRNVRSFRVLVVKDARWFRRPPLRHAQITVWDVLNVTHDEGGRAGHFEAGQRFLVTNLMPSKQSAWMAVDYDAEVYLTTRRDTGWTRVKNK